MHIADFLLSEEHKNEIAASYIVVRLQNRAAFSIEEGYNAALRQHTRAASATPKLGGVGHPRRAPESTVSPGKSTFGQAIPRKGGRPGNMGQL